MTPLTLPHMYSELHTRILDEKCVRKKTKSDVVSYLMIHKSNVALAILQSTMFVLQSTLFTVGVLHIEAMSNFFVVYQIYCCSFNTFVNNCVVV
jgi:hypothetical protein